MIFKETLIFEDSQHNILFAIYGKMFVLSVIHFIYMKNTIKLSKSRSSKALIFTYWLSNIATKDSWRNIKAN